jgi:hypothetical protein
MMLMTFLILFYVAHPQVAVNKLLFGAQAQVLLNTLLIGTFMNRTQGSDVHGNDFGGYNYAKLTVWGDIDNMAASWLYGDYLDDGSGGLKAWFGETSKYNSYGITEKNYRLGGYSTNKMYQDFETSPFQPIDNLGQYWFQKFLTNTNGTNLRFCHAHH